MIRKFVPYLLLVFFVVLFPMIAFAQGPLPDAATASPADQGSFVWGLYKAGHLVPAIIVGAFFGLALAEKRIAWLRAGYRKLFVACALATLGMLAERVASGTTPNLKMVMGAVGVGFAMWMKTHGGPHPETAAEPPKA